MRITWIDKRGKIHENDGKGICNHLEIADKLFPESNNPELDCEKAGYVKTGLDFNGLPMMIAADPDRVTRAQHKTLEKLWDEHYKEKKNAD